MISFVGLYIALSVATDFATTQWITAVAGGLFMYVGLADMVSHIRGRLHQKHKGVKVTSASWLVLSAAHAGPRQEQEAVVDVCSAEPGPSDGVERPAAAVAFWGQNPLLTVFPGERSQSSSDVRFVGFSSVKGHHEWETNWIHASTETFNAPKRSAVALV